MHLPPQFSLFQEGDELYEDTNTKSSEKLSLQRSNTVDFHFPKAHPPSLQQNYVFFIYRDNFLFVATGEVCPLSFPNCVLGM